MSRLLLCGRVARSLFPVGGGTSGKMGQLLVIDVCEGSAWLQWAAFCDLDETLGRQIAEGEVVAIVGTLDPKRKWTGAIRGPVAVEAILGLTRENDIFRGVSP